MSATPPFKQPVSVLVVIHTPARDILLLERRTPPGFWQSVTGSLEAGETARAAAIREVAEETGLTASATTLRDWRQTNRFEIRAEWRHRYAPGVTHNVEHVFSLCVPEICPIRLADDEHAGYLWLPQPDAAAKVFSWTNREAILRL
ncbi:MAG TPA: dihydroneopterin triphosphate diphosphatase [Rhodocyclaceae bacterium]|nr:dihydroneopterin triphosphate diphosphatase [Rhodocyclaceae bacterium]